MAIYKVSMYQENSRALEFFFGSIDDIWSSIELTWKDTLPHERPVIRRNEKVQLNYWIADVFGNKIGDIVFVTRELSKPTNLIKSSFIGV